MTFSRPFSYPSAHRIKQSSKFSCGRMSGRSRIELAWTRSRDLLTRSGRVEGAPPVDDWRDWFAAEAAVGQQGSSPASPPIHEQALRTLRECTDDIADPCQSTLTTLLQRTSVNGRGALLAASTRESGPAYARSMPLDPRLLAVLKRLSKLDKKTVVVHPVNAYRSASHGVHLWSGPIAGPMKGQAVRYRCLNPNCGRECGGWKDPDFKSHCSYWDSPGFH
jgi:hypothetical protein